MIDYISAMVNDFPTKFKQDDTAPNPAAEDLFAEDTTDDLDTQQAAKYHIFICKATVHLQASLSIYWTPNRRVVNTREKPQSE